MLSEVSSTCRLALGGKASHYLARGVRPNLGSLALAPLPRRHHHHFSSPIAIFAHSISVQTRTAHSCVHVFQSSIVTLIMHSWLNMKHVLVSVPFLHCLLFCSPPGKHEQRCICVGDSWTRAIGIFNLPISFIPWALLISPSPLPSRGQAKLLLLSILTWRLMFLFVASISLILLRIPQDCSNQVSCCFEAPPPHFLIRCAPRRRSSLVAPSSAPCVIDSSFFCDRYLINASRIHGDDPCGIRADPPLWLYILAQASLPRH